MTIRKIVFVGAGAIGGSVSAWLTGNRPDVSCYDRPEILDAIETAGISHYDGTAGPSSADKVKVAVLRELSGLGENDLLVFGVKNFGLDAVAKDVAAATSGRPLALSMANGLDNQSILPRHFKRCLYGVVGYNAWLDAPGLIGWQSRGPLVLGTPDNSLQAELKSVADELSKGLEVHVTDRLGDAAHSKLVVNLVNTITTLVGQGFREISDTASMQRLVSRTLREGVRVVEAAGFKECHVGSMPSFAKIRASALLPAFATRGMFKASMAKMVRSSMSQDVLQRGGTATELESLTGYIVWMGEKFGVSTPWNSGLYRIAAKAFSKPGFKPIEPAELLKAVEESGTLK